MQGIQVVNVDTVDMRRAGKELLSLALMDSRNHTLRWAAAFEEAPADRAARVDSVALARNLGEIAWFQEFWIARNVQRQRGEQCDPTHPKLASILPGADGLFDPVNRSSAWSEGSAPDLRTVREYLVDSLETTLELLDSAKEDDAGLYFYRLALLREDACVERFAVRAQSLGFDPGLLAQQLTHAARSPLTLSAMRWRLGCSPGGFVFDREKWAHEVSLAEFEIDAQAVSWAQYCEFVEDGGYDDRRQWSEPGWAWVQAQGRRTPRFVDQMRQGVLQQRFGRLMRVPLAHPVVHVSWFEAEAWCRWAARRLPSEAEWEAAAIEGASRGFRWGEVREWTAGTLRPYPGYAGPSPGQHPVERPGHGQGPRSMRGASFATRGRLRSEKARFGASPARDEAFCGFRSCAI